MNRTVKCSEVIQELNRLFPQEAAEEWDNPGLLTGRHDADVSRILVTLDASDKAIEEAAAMRADLLVSHHPLIFGGLRRVNDLDLTGRRVLRLIELGMACFAMHTNYDVCRMADLNADQLQLTDREVLMVTDVIDGTPQGIGRVGTLPREMKLSEAAAFVKEQMRLPDVLVYGAPEAVVSRAAVSGGSGKSVVADAASKGAQVLITGDLDYHTATDAVAGGMYVIDAGHYGTEYCFIDDVVKTLSELFPELEIRGASVRHPYYII